MVGVGQPVARLEEGAVGPAVDLQAVADAHGGRDHRQQHGVGAREGGAVGRGQAGGDDVGPGQPAPAPPQVVRAGGDPGHGHGRRADLVGHRLADEADLDGGAGAGGGAVQPGDRDEEVDAGDLAGAASTTVAKPPPLRPVKMVSAAQLTSIMATAASTALPPARRVARPAAVVEGWPAATPALIRTGSA